jgi:hypothetical protein
MRLEITNALRESGVDVPHDSPTGTVRAPGADVIYLTPFAGEGSSS